MKIFLERLKKLRLEKGLLQRKFAQLLGLPQSTHKGYGLLGAPNGHELTMQTIVSIAKFFKASTDYLFGLEH